MGNAPRVSARQLTREECIENLRQVTAGIFRRLARAEAEGTLTPTEARVVARMRARQAEAEAQQPPAAA